MWICLWMVILLVNNTLILRSSYMAGHKKEADSMWSQPLFMCFFWGGLLNFVLCEVGATHEVGSGHAFFAGKLHLVEMDVAVLYSNF